MKGYTVPDTIWPSSNEYGIPDLLPQVAPYDLPLPFLQWSEIPMKTRLDKGAYHFYTEDRYFECVWRDPMKPLAANIEALVECNFSTGPRTPRAVRPIGRTSFSENTIP